MEIGHSDGDTGIYMEHLNILYVMNNCLQNSRKYL